MLTEHSLTPITSNNQTTDSSSFPDFTLIKTSKGKLHILQGLPEEFGALSEYFDELSILHSLDYNGTANLFFCTSYLAKKNPWDTVTISQGCQHVKAYLNVQMINAAHI